MTAQSRAIDRIMRICATAAMDDRSLRVAILNEIRPVVAFDAFVWLLTDPQTEVGCSPPGRRTLPARIAAADHAQVPHAVQSLDTIEGPGRTHARKQWGAVGTQPRMELAAQPVWGHRRGDRGFSRPSGLLGFPGSLEDQPFGALHRIRGGFPTLDREGCDRGASRVAGRHFQARPANYSWGRAGSPDPVPGAGGASADGRDERVPAVADPTRPRAPADPRRGLQRWRAAPRRGGRGRSAPTLGACAPVSRSLAYAASRAARSPGPCRYPGHSRYHRKELTNGPTGALLESP